MSVRHVILMEAQHTFVQVKICHAGLPITNEISRSYQGQFVNGDSQIGVEVVLSLC